ncbi:MAG: DUF2948 family protein [Alphaproteobacteria bacterium]|nr:MAG: DUF2948 family protein [Alphaproteobacteria bacterium]
MADARFEDAAETPLRLIALGAEDLAVISALVQDAVGVVGDTAWMPRRRRFAMLINRFRWEDREAAERAGRTYERVRAVLALDGVLSARADGIDPHQRDTVFSVLSLDFEPDAEPPGGTLRIRLAGDGEIVLSVECLEVSLTDVTRPHRALAGRAPDHGA